VIPQPERTRLLRDRRGAAAGVALLVTSLAAIRALDPAARAGGGFLTEIAAYLCIGVVIVCAARTATRAASIARRPARLRVRLLGRVTARACVDGAVAIALSLPALAAAWEAGASRGEAIAVLVALAAATLCGCGCGSVLGGLRLPALPAVGLAVGAAAFLLWPASLGFSARPAAAFPVPEPAVLPLALGLVLLAALGWAGLGAPARKSR
jgi:hypothetical protein